MKLSAYQSAAVLSRNFLAATVLAGLLAACGGSDSPPANQVANVPTSATTSLVGDEAQARDLIQLIVAADSSATGNDESFKRVNTDLLRPPSGGSLPATVAIKTALRSMSGSVVSKRETATIPCAELFELGQAQSGSFIESCTGSLTFDSNFDEFDGEVLLPAGSYFNSQYNNMTLVLTDGSSATLSGSMNISVTAPIAIVGSGFTGAMQVSAVDLRGVSEDGENFGPESFLIEVTFNADGSVSVVSDGVRIENIDIVGTGSDDSYLITGGSVIQPYGDGHADVSFQNWNVVNNLPQAGSVVFVEGTNGSATVTVVSASATSIEFRVDLTVDSSPSSHTVFATVDNGTIVVN